MTNTIFDVGTTVQVVGNGVAGWISSLYLVENGEQVVMYNNPNTIIRRIGESTIPVINEISQILGITDQELVDRSNGYFKYGNVFEGWGRDNWIYYAANEDNNLATKQRQTFSYHIDAPKFCELLKEHCVSKPNFKIIPRDFTLEDYNDTDMFIDATGESGILSKHVGVKHIESDVLINDHAIVANGEPRYDPFTRAQTMDAGWMWSISLQSRMSYGYVFSSKFISIEDAKKEFTEKTGLEAENVIKFKSRRPVEQWVGNVVAVGISAGFIEPLNATANFIAQASIKQLIALRHKPKVYNRLMSKVYEGIHKWVNALYGTNNAKGPYWDHFKQYKEQSLADIKQYSKHGHQGLMSKHSWNLLKENML